MKKNQNYVDLHRDKYGNNKKSETSKPKNKYESNSSNDSNDSKIKELKEEKGTLENKDDTIKELKDLNLGNNDELYNEIADQLKKLGSIKLNKKKANVL